MKSMIYYIKLESSYKKIKLEKINCKKTWKKYLNHHGLIS
jgi:hypothetical protein